MSLPEFYEAVQREVNDSDICFLMPAWEDARPTVKEFYGLLYGMATNGAFDGIPRKNRANPSQYGKRNAKKLLANPRSGA